MEAFATSDGRGTVVVVHDGSAAAAATLAVARRLADQLDARLTLLHLTLRDEPARVFAGSHPRHRTADDRDAAARHGRPVSGVLALASDPATLLVALTASHNDGRPGSALSRIIDKAARPLLLVSRSVAAPQWTGLRRLLIPLDGAPSTFRALAPIVCLAERLGAELDLLYVADPDAPPPTEPGTLALPVYLDQPQHAWPEWQHEVIRTLAACAGLPALTVPVNVSIATGALVDALLRRAAASHPDAIALAHHARPGPRRTSILRALLDRAPYPLLLGVATACGPAPGRLSRRYRPS